MRPVLVVGGYGTFGRRVCRALADRGVPVTVAGRDGNRAARLAGALGAAHKSLAVDLGDADAVRGALDGHAVAANCAGPFPAAGQVLLEACLATGRHHVDLSDDRGWAARVRARDGVLAEAGLVAAYGCSSLPGLSGALAVEAAAALGEPVDAVEVTLAIGNRNPKGEATIASAVSQVGRRFEAPQGPLTAFRDRSAAELPSPFGRRRVPIIDAPEYDLFPVWIGARAVRVHVALELRPASALFGLLARMPWRAGRGTARALTAAGRLGSGIGVSGGGIQVRVRGVSGRGVTGWIGGAAEGQALAALPCALVAEALARGAPAGGGVTGSGGAGPAGSVLGARAAHEVLGARPLLEAVAAEGFDLAIDAPDGPECEKA